MAQLESMLKRRDFLRMSAGLGLLAGCRHQLGGSGLTEIQPPTQIEGKGRTVVVLGAGPAGLCTAYELDKMGFSVTVLEKTKRVSGRVWTQYDFFDDGQYCELGATRIPDCHDLTIGYAKKLGLELAALDHGPLDNTMYSLDGITRFKKPGKDHKPWPEDRGSIESGYTGKAFPQMGDPSQRRWPQSHQGSKSSPAITAAKIQEWDSMTFAGYLQSIGYSDFARKVVQSANGSEVNMYSALAWLAGEYLEREWDRTYRIKGVNEQLARRFAAQLSLGSRVELLADVLAVEAKGNKTVVSYKQRGDLKSLEADYCICALPLNVIQKINWLPRLSPSKIRASQEVKMQAVTRINLQFKNRFWENSSYDIKGLKVLHSDFTFERLWDMSGSEDQKHRKGKTSSMGILTAYVQYENARTLGALAPEDRITTVLNQMSQVFPEAKSQFHKGGSFVWHQQDWIGGGWSAYAPGQIDLYLATQTPEGNILFAGDHTSLEPGWIQGAFHSAHRVIEELGQLVTKGKVV
jgi:monoamine oxidase